MNLVWLPCKATEYAISDRTGIKYVVFNGPHCIWCLASGFDIHEAENWEEAKRWAEAFDLTQPEKRVYVPSDEVEEPERSRDGDLGADRDTVSD